MNTELWIPPNITPNKTLRQSTTCSDVVTTIDFNSRSGGCSGIDCANCIISPRHQTEFEHWINGRVTITQPSQFDLF